MPRALCHDQGPPHHDPIPERFPDLIFPTKRNFRLWRAKTWIAKLQARRILTEKLDDLQIRAWLDWAEYMELDSLAMVRTRARSRS